DTWPQLSRVARRSPAPILDHRPKPPGSGATLRGDPGDLLDRCIREHQVRFVAAQELAADRSIRIFCDSGSTTTGSNGLLRIYSATIPHLRHACLVRIRRSDL